MFEDFYDANTGAQGTRLYALIICHIKYARVRQCSSESLKSAQAGDSVAVTLNALKRDTKLGLLQSRLNLFHKQNSSVFSNEPGV